MISLAMLGVLSCAGCYDPPVTETLLLEMKPDGRVTMEVETSFKPDTDLKPGEREQVQRVLDLYELGRDPWLRGFERADAEEIGHQYMGAPGHPGGISRSGVLPSLSAVVTAMPDAIANLRLLHDAATGRDTLRITHIDLPESLRENRRRIEREIEALAVLGFRFSVAHCDLYGYLAANVDRRHDVLQALDDESRIEGMLTPRETVLIGRVAASLEALTSFPEKKPPPIVAAMSFAPFDHEFCLRLPDGAEMLAPDGFVKRTDVMGTTTWCAPRLTIAELADDLFPRADPPLLDETIRKDAARLASASFTCERQPDEVSMTRELLERILPHPLYEIVWKPAIAGAPGPRS